MRLSPIDTVRNRLKIPPSFRELVYRATKQIPKGKVATYVEIAQTIGSPKSARAVGNALNKNPFKSVPCHRVVRSDGTVGGYARGNSAKTQKLMREGIRITRGKIDLKKFSAGL